MEFASKGVAGAGLGLGIAGTALGLVNGGLGNIFGGLGSCQANQNHMGDTALAAAAGMMASAAMNQPRTVFSSGTGGWCCSEDHTVNRYEAAQAAQIANLETEVKLRDANIYTDQKLLEVYKYFDGENKAIREELCQQRVHNQRTEDSFVLARQDTAAVKAELEAMIRMEAERRCCADNSIVNYANNTFYPKMVAAVETGTDTTAQTLYNPIPKCGCCCGNGNG